MSFTHADVQNIIQLLDASHFDELLLEVDGVKLELRRGGAGRSSVTSAPASQPGISTPAATPAAAATPASPPPHNTAAQPAANTDLQEIRAPMLGTYYSAPKPGAAPFVSVGSRVEPDMVVGIIEVMKLMNSTSAGISGEIVEILVKDGDLVEYDQPLMRVRA